MLSEAHFVKCPALYIDLEGNNLNLKPQIK